MATQHPEYTHLLLQNQTRRLDLAAQRDAHTRADRPTPTFSDTEVGTSRPGHLKAHYVSFLPPQSIRHVKKTWQIASLHALCQR